MDDWVIRMKSRLMSNKRAILTASVAVIVVVSGQPANAAPDPLGPLDRDQQRTVVTRPVVEPDAFWKRQEVLDNLVEGIRSIGSDSAADGISGAVVDADQNLLSLYWHGAVPTRVMERINSARTEGIKIVLQPAPYTEAELLREADRMSRTPLFRGVRTEQRTMRVGPLPDGTGLEVGIHGLPPNTDVAQAKQMVPALDSAIPLSITPINPVSFASRAIDTAPYWGGSFIHNRTSGFTCTSAFGVSGGGSTFLMTAAHCGTGSWGSALYRDSAGHVTQDVYGFVSGRAVERDVQIIRTAGGSGGHVYWGPSVNPPNDPGSNSGAAVGGDSANNVNDAICLSGSFTGSICSSTLRIARTNITMMIDPPLNGVGRITNLASASDIAGSTTGITGQGDSGGPVVSVRSDGKLLARGVVSGFEGGFAERPCVGYTPPGRVCSSVVYFADLRSAMSVIGVRINTA